MREPCCKMMEFFLDHTCPDHPNPFDCPDHIIYHDSRHNDYGIIIHDGGQSVVQIAYCPWCGAKL